MPNTDSFAYKTFPHTLKQFSLFLLVMAGTVFVLGTSYLSGPMRWMASLVQSRSWNPNAHDALHLALIVMLIGFSSWLALKMIQTMLRTPYRHIRFGLPALLLIFLSTDIFYWLYPDWNFLKWSRADKGAVLNFIYLCIPGFKAVVLLAPGLLLYTAFIGWIVGWMRVVKEIRIPYTRKVFHFFIFTMAAGLQPAFGLSSVVLFGLIAGLSIWYAVLRGDGFPFYEAIARKTDAPHSKFFVMIPLLSTAVGGVAANLISIRFAPIGYLITGWGDAVAEPVGSRWGKHWYKVPGLDGIHVTRSFEGSFAILIIGGIVAYFWCLLTGMPSMYALKTALLCASVGTLVEGVSNHGLDNFTIQAAVTAAAVWLAG